MLLYTMLHIVLAYLMLFAALSNSVCLNNASSFFFLFFVVVVVVVVDNICFLSGL